MVVILTTFQRFCSKVHKIETCSMVIFKYSIYAFTLPIGLTTSKSFLNISRGVSSGIRFFQCHVKNFDTFNLHD